jgi:hypothetical protein
VQVIITRHGESLNGQGDVRRLLMDGYRAEEIIAVREQETGIIRTFTEQSQVYFAERGWSEVSWPDAVPRSIEIVQRLSETTRSVLRMRHEKWMTESGTGDSIKFQNSTHRMSKHRYKSCRDTRQNLTHHNRINIPANKHQIKSCAKDIHDDQK